MWRVGCTPWDEPAHAFVCLTLHELACRALKAVGGSPSARRRSARSAHLVSVDQSSDVIFSSRISLRISGAHDLTSGELVPICASAPRPTVAEAAREVDALWCAAAARSSLVRRSPPSRTRSARASSSAGARRASSGCARHRRTRWRTRSAAPAMWDCLEDPRPASGWRGRRGLTAVFRASAGGVGRTSFPGYG